ncbi:MAG: hypothetical protein GY821_12640 [Gammaproteobacteria bacterium]|nr:hypothetical protein [Gammaproteobacteria bacterium]
MSFITKNHNQTIVYWGNPVKDKYGGRTFDTPVEISGRWEQNQKLFTDDAGRESVSKAFVFLGQDVVLGGYLYLGTLVSISSAANPGTVADAYEIRAFTKIPNIKADDFERKIIL